MGFLDVLGPVGRRLRGSFARATQPLSRRFAPPADSDDLFNDEFQRKLDYLAIVSRRVFSGAMRAERRTKKTGSGVEFADHREYAPGDDFRYLDWSAYQRFDKLLIRLFEEEEDLAIYFILDTSSSMGFGDGAKLRQAKRLCAALAYVGLANLDRIAKDSLVFTRAYSTATHSNYAQMATLSSLFPRRGGSLDVYERLDYPRVLLHDAASKMGFETATISSQDETWQGMLRFQTTNTPTFFRHAKDFQGEHLQLGTEDVAPDEETVREAIAWLDSTSGRPFSIYVNLQSTHFPYPIPKNAARPFTPFEPEGTFNYVSWDKAELPTILNRYDNALHYVDAQVGALFDALKERGMLEDTVFVVTADHGEMFFEHDLVTHGRTLHEEEARVPFIVHYPDGVSARMVDEAVSTVDVLPTMIELAGAPPHPAFQGESVARLGLGEGSHGAAVFLNIQGWKHYDGIVCMPYKLVFDPDSQQSALYDLVSDPHEMRDVAKDKPDVVVSLSAVLQSLVGPLERCLEVKGSH